LYWCLDIRQTVAAKAPSEDMMAAVAPYFEAEAQLAPLRQLYGSESRDFQDVFHSYSEKKGISINTSQYIYYIYIYMSILFP
jgi:hypothetical protein